MQTKIHFHHFHWKNFDKTVGTATEGRAGLGFHFDCNHAQRDKINKIPNPEQKIPNNPRAEMNGTL